MIDYYTLNNIIIFIICSIVAIVISKLYTRFNDKLENEINKTFLLTVSKIIIIEFVIVFFIGFLGYLFVSLTCIFSFKVDLWFVSLFLVFFYLIPLFFAAVCGKKYSLGKSKGNLVACWIWALISLVINLYTLSEHVCNVYGRVSFILSYLPNITYIIACYKVQFKCK